MTGLILAPGPVLVALYQEQSAELYAQARQFFDEGEYDIAAMCQFRAYIVHDITMKMLSRFLGAE